MPVLLLTLKADVQMEAIRMTMAATTEMLQREIRECVEKIHRG